MFRIDSQGATPEHRFTEGNALQGILPTKLTAEWLGSVQQEIAQTIEKSGIVLDKNNNTQLLQAIFKVMEKGKQPFCFDLPEGRVSVAERLGDLSFDHTQVIGGYLKAFYFLNDAQLSSQGTLQATFYYNSGLASWSLTPLPNPNSRNEPEVVLGMTTEGELTYKKPFPQWSGKLYLLSIKTIKKNVE